MVLMHVKLILSLSITHMKQNEDASTLENSISLETMYRYLFDVKINNQTNSQIDSVYLYILCNKKKICRNEYSPQYIYSFSDD